MLRRKMSKKWVKWCVSAGCFGEFDGFLMFGTEKLDYDVYFDEVVWEWDAVGYLMFYL